MKKHSALAVFALFAGVLVASPSFAQANVQYSAVVPFPPLKNGDSPSYSQDDQNNIGSYPSNNQNRMQYQGILAAPPKNDY